MNKVLNYIVDVFIAIIIMFASVTVYFGLRMEPEIKTLIKIATNDIVSDAKKNGYITLDDYEEYMKKLSLTDTIYNVEFEHSYKVWEPLYRKRTLQEIIDAQNAAYTGKNVYTYREINTELPVVYDPISTGNLNTETNKSVMAKAINTSASPSHVHTDDCYDGIKHVHTGNKTEGGGCYGKSIPSYSCNASLSISGTNEATICLVSCPNCGTLYTCSVVEHYIEYICTEGHKTSSVTSKDYSCSHCGYTDSKNYGILNNCLRSIVGYELNCGKTEGNYYNGDTSVNPTCSQVVVSISPTHPIQTGAIGEEIISTVVATYLDGSQKTIIANVSGYNSTKIGTQIVTLTYSGLIDNAKKTGKKTSSINVKVVPLSKTCIKGHTYNLNADCSDPGCPYCKAYVATLQLIYPTSTDMTITIGTTLKDNGVKLLVTYMDGHTETITDGYADNLDTKYLGTMLVSIGYKGVKTQLRVTTICKKMICPICRNTYNLYPNGTDPGCPYCVAKIPVFTGKIMSYTETEYTEQILNEICKKGIYSFSKNDMFTIRIKNKSSNVARRIMQKLLPSLPGEWLNLRKSENISTNPR